MRPFVLALTIVALASSIPVPASAQVVSEICYAPEQSSAAATPPTSSTQFSCPITGTFTISQLAAQGFRVVSLTPVTGVAQFSIRQQLVVKRVVRIHGSGFEP